MDLLTTLFGSNDESETDEEPETVGSPLYRVTWTEMEEVTKTTATIQFGSGKQKRVSYTHMNGRDDTILVDETSDCEQIQVNWDNIEYVDTESVETVEVPTDRSGLFNSEELGGQLTKLYEEPSVVSETVEWEQLE